LFARPLRKCHGHTLNYQHGNDFMTPEIEAKFLNINKDEMRKRLKEKGAKLIRPEFLQKRVNFHLPKEKQSKDAWLRVRDEGDKITLSLKMITGEKIEDQKEISFIVEDFNKAVILLEAIGCERRVLQESKRELWQINDVDITIDEWPGLEPFVEIEGKSENEVRNIAQLLNFNYNDAVFGAVGKVYKMRYGISLDEMEQKVGEITFVNKKLKYL